MAENFLFMDRIDELYRGGGFHRFPNQEYLQDMIIGHFPDAEIKVFQSSIAVAEYLNHNLPPFSLDMDIPHSIRGIINPLAHQDYRNLADFYSRLGGELGYDLTSTFALAEENIDSVELKEGKRLEICPFSENNLYARLGNIFFEYTAIPIFQSYVFTPGHRNIPAMVGKSSLDGGIDASEFIKSAFELWLNSLKK